MNKHGHKWTYLVENIFNIAFRLEKRNIFVHFRSTYIHKYDTAKQLTDIEDDNIVPLL